MSLTQRQTEFLNCIVEHYRRKDTPVHYTAVAEWMGVSKWTAYDMLRRLEQKGYLESYCDVSVKGGTPGRSQVLFRPIDQVQNNHLEQLDWPSWRAGKTGANFHGI